MKYNDLLDLIKTREGYTLELKESINSSLGKEICAFANSQGGKIILGVKDNGDIKGIKLTNQDISRIQDIARNMSPSFYVHIEQIKDLGIIYVPEGKEKPYTLGGSFYIRQGANSQQLNRDEIRTFFQKENLISFEKQTQDFDNKDFSNDAFKIFKKESNLNLNKEQLFKNLNLTTNDKLNNAGVLYFSKNIKKYLPNSVITCVLYEDNEQVEILDKKEFNKDFKTNLEEAYKYVISKLNDAIIITGKIKHDRKLELPKEALREAIINAMIHKDYLFPSHVQINITKEKVEIINPGKLLFPKKEFGTTSAYRNPILADLLLRTGDIEKIGSGIKRIKKFCKEQNIKVSFQTNEIFRIVFYRSGIDTKVDTINGTINDTINETQIKILAEIKRNVHITYDELAKKINKSRRTIIRNIDELKEKNILKRAGSRKTGHWKILK